MNRKSFLTKLGLATASLAFWKRDSTEASPGLPPCKTCAEQEAKGLAVDCLYKLTSDLNAEQLLESRFPNLISHGGWLLFSYPGVEGCNLQGTSGFVWCEVHGSEDDLKALGKVFMCNAAPCQCGIGDLFTMRLRTPIIDGADGLAECGKVLDTELAAKLRGLPVVTGWREAQAEACAAFDLALKSPRNRLPMFSKDACQVPMQTV